MGALLDSSTNSEMPCMNILRSAVAVFQLETRLLRNFPKLRVSVLGIVLIPALYSFIYLESVWDPAQRTDNQRLRQGFFLRHRAYGQVGYIPPAEAEASYRWQPASKAAPAASA